MSGDRARVELAQCRDGVGKVGAGTQHGVHDVPDLGLVLDPIYCLVDVRRACWERSGFHRSRNTIAVSHSGAIHDLGNVSGLVQDDRVGIAVSLDMHAEIFFGFVEVNHRVFCREGLL